MVETDGVAGLFRRNIAGELGRELHAGLCVQNRLHTACTGQSLAHLNDEVGQLDQLDQDLVHIVDQCDDIAGGHAPMLISMLPTYSSATMARLMIT